MNVEKLLPIGSVVLLKGGNKKIMIFGIKQSDQEEKQNKEYDYIGVMWPEGNIGTEYQFMFNNDDISEVFFEGYSTDERNEFLKKLTTFYNQ